MSDFLLSDGSIEFGPLEDSLRFTRNTQISRLNWKRLSGLCTQVHDAKRWQPATDPVSGVSVVIAGRLAFDADVWRHAEALPYSGGVAAKAVIDRWLHAPDELPLSLNGGFAVAIHDPAAEQLTLITDRLGVLPVYRFESQSGLLLGTHPDLLADAATQQGQYPELDFATMADALVTGSAQHPYTYYQQVRQLEPASVYQFDLRTGCVTQSPYWGTQNEPAYRSDSDMAEEVAESLKAAVRRRTHECCGKVGLFLSGGADSRAILFAARQPAKVDTLTFYDKSNTELQVAKALAKAAGSRHVALKRQFDHYGDAAREVVRITGGYWSIKDAHYHGFLPQLEAMGMDTLMTGCYADYLLKGLAFNVRSKRVCGRPVPVKEMAPFGFAYYQPFSEVAPEWRDKVNERLEQRFPPGSRSDYEGKPWLTEDLRVRPLSREADGMGRAYLWRTMPWDPVMLDSDLADCFHRMTPDQKMNAKVFRRAVMQIVGERGGQIANSNDGVPLDASDNLRIFYYFQQRLRLKAASLFGQRQQRDISTSGSWPDFARYVRQSDHIRDQWQQAGVQQKEILSELLGYDPWQHTMEYWGTDDRVSLFLRLLTLKIWLDERGYK